MKQWNRRRWRLFCVVAAVFTAFFTGNFLLRARVAVSTKRWLPMTASTIHHHDDKAHPTTNTTIDMLFELKGGLGNQLHGLRKIMIIQKAIEQAVPGIEVKIHYKFQGNNRALAAARDLNSCFPAHRKTDFLEWTVHTYELLLNTTTQWKRRHPNQMIDAGSSLQNLTNAIKVIILARQHNESSIFTMKHSSMPIPYIDMVSTGFKKLPYGINNIIGDEMLIKAFALNRNITACCREQPDPDETVLHVRGFTVELKNQIKRGRVAGYHEVSPNDTAYGLLGHLKKHDRVAIVARYPQEVQEHVKMLQARGLRVRVVAGQSGIQDFCFLASSKKLAGQTKSTYFYWATQLANAVRIDTASFNGSTVTFARKINGTLQ